MMKKAILISCFAGWYITRLKPIKHILEMNGYKVVVLLGDFDHRTKSYYNQREPECEYLHVPNYTKNLSLMRLYSHVLFGKAVYNRLCSVKPDLIYLLLPPNNTAYRCLKYVRSTPNTKYITDLIDMWPESMPIEKFRLTPIYKIWANLRNSSIREADFVVTECRLYQKKLAGIISNDKNGVLPLMRKQSFEEKKSVETILSNYQVQNEEIRLAYLGSINHIIDVASIVKVIKALRTKYKKVTLHIIGDGESRAELIECTTAAGAEVVYHGKIFDESEKINILSNCDFGLNMMKSNITVGLTIKSVDYFSKGLPIINNIQGDTWNMVINEQIGINYYGNNDDFSNAVLKCNISMMKRRTFEFFHDTFTEKAFENKIKQYLSSIL